MSNIGVFVGNTETGMVIDEKRRQVLNTRSMSDLQVKQLQTEFRNMRPDLSTFDDYRFSQQLYVGESYLEYMKQKVNKEIQRVCLQTAPSFRIDKVKNYEKISLQLGHPFIRGGRSGCNRNWQEATALVNYIDLLKLKVYKYGLQYPILAKDLDKSQCLLQQNIIADHIFREMTKS